MIWLCQAGVCRYRTPRLLCVAAAVAAWTWSGCSAQGESEMQVERPIEGPVCPSCLEPGEEEFRKSRAAAGDPAAMLWLSGKAKSPSEMRRWMEMAVLRGHAPAMGSLAHLLMASFPGHQRQARRLLESAVGLGSFRAMGDLGSCLWNGACGRDPAGALTWALVGRFVAAEGRVWVEIEQLDYYEGYLSSMGMTETLCRVFLDDAVIREAEQAAAEIAERLRAVWL